MSKRQMNLIRIATIVLLLLLALLLILCSDRIKLGKDTTTSPTPGIPSELSSTPFPDTKPSSGSEPTSALDTPTPTPVIIDASDLIDMTGSNPHSSLFNTIQTGISITTDGILYCNYLNSMTTLYMTNGVIAFTDNGYYTFTGTDGTSHTFRISDDINFSELFSGDTAVSDGSWFFLGALETKEHLFVQYDYWGQDELSVFFRMDKDGRNTILVYAALYDETINEAIFTASNEAIFYIYTTHDSITGAVESSLMQANFDGSTSGILLSFPDGYSAHHLGLAGNAVLFMLTDSNDNTSLLRLDTETQALTYICEHCPVSDYLYIFDHYALVGTTSSKLIAYDITNCVKKEIALTTDISSPKFGLPVFNSTSLYLQYFRWDKSCATCILPIDFVAEASGDPIQLKDSLCYVTGISENAFYAESNGGYLSFLLQ